MAGRAHVAPSLSDVSDNEHRTSDEDDPEDEDDPDEIEEEPLLKYRRVKAGVVRILTGGAFTPDGGLAGTAGSAAPAVVFLATDGIDSAR